MLRNPFRKQMERVTDIRKVMEKVHMVFFYIKYHSHSREKVKKTIRVFTSFRNEMLGVADADVAADCF